jgi:hypothetical protein
VCQQLLYCFVNDSVIRHFGALQPTSEFPNTVDGRVHRAVMAPWGSGKGFGGDAGAAVINQTFKNGRVCWPLFRFLTSRWDSWITWTTRRTALVKITRRISTFVVRKWRRLLQKR